MIATTWNSKNRELMDDLTDSATDDEFSLIRAVAKGHKESFENLFHLYHPRIYKFSIRMLQDHQLAEEVTCDTLYAVWNGASKFRGQSAVSSWIFGIAYRRSLKSYNKRARQTNGCDPDFNLENITDTGTDSNPEAYNNNLMDGMQLLKALEKLSVNHRAVIELSALGHSCSEIASIVGCPENTVKTRAFHARRHLRTALQE